MYRAQQEPTTPPATITQQPGLLSRIFDLLSRFGYASASAGLAFTRRAQDYPQEYQPFGLDPVLWLFQRGGESNRTVLGDVWQSFLSGLRGETPASWRDTAIELGVPEEPILPNAPGFLGDITWAGAAGFAGDLFLDPLNWVGIGAINRVGRAAQAAGKLKGLRSAQALAGQRDLITIAGRGPSSLPGRAGEIARRAQAAVFRIPEAIGEKIQQTPLGQEFLKWATTKGTGPLRVVRERLRQRGAEERFLTRQATREYGNMHRKIIDIANKYGLDPEELQRTITFEAERKVSSAPSVQYVVKPGDTLSSISERFGTTVESLAENNRIADPNRIQAGQVIEVPMPQEAQEIIESIRAAQPERLAREHAAGVMTPEFESERIEYLHRELSDEFRQYLDSRRNRKLAEWLSQNRPILAVTHGAQRARTIDPDAYIREINQAAVEGRTKLVWVDENGNIVPKGTKGATEQYVITDTPQKNPPFPRMPIFTENPAVIELSRERMTIRSVTTAQALDDIVRLGTSEGWAVKATTKEAVEELLKQGWRTVQAPRFGDKLKDIYFPKEVADEIDKFMDLFRNKETRSLLRDLLLWWRDMTLFILPRYFMRNFGTGVIKNYYAGLLPGDPAYLQGQLFALLRQADMLAPRYGMADDLAQSLGQLKQAAIKTKDGKTYTLQQILDWYEAERLGQGFITTTFSGSSGTASEMLTGRGFELRRLNPFRRDNYAIEAGKAFGVWVEDNLRGSLFIKKIKEGYPPHEAANFVRNYHFDYSELPEWAKRLRDYQIAPFISWAVKNLPNELATLIQEPGKVAGVIKFARAVEAEAEGPRPTPEEIPSFLIFPVYVGRDEAGNPRFANILSAWGMLDVAEISTDALRYAVLQLHGWLQEILEQAVNWDFYFQRNIVPPELERVGAPAPSGPFGLHPRIEHALQTLSPYTVVEQFYDPNITPTQALIRFLTSYTEYTSDPYYSRVAPFRNFEDAVSYYRSQIFKYRARAQEAMRRGDVRAAYLNQRLADRWEQTLRENFDRLYEQLPR